ncbi:MAG: AI-2E family transporter [Hyphomicrobiaceae bacterium]
MTLKQQALVWLAVLAAALLFIALLNGILLPFVAGIVTAYIMSPLVDRIEAMGVSRGVATLALLLAMVLTGVLALIFLAPLVVDQLTALIEAIPGIYARLLALADELSSKWIGGVDQVPGPSQMGGLTSGLAEALTTVLRGVLSGGLALVNFLGLLAVTPVVAFYLLVDWPAIVDSIDRALPRPLAPRIRELAGEIDRKLAAFFRGQGLVCLVMGAYYAIALSMAGLKYGLLIGLFAGLAGFIPLVGAILAGLVAIGMAISQFWPELTPVLLVAGVFALGQVLDGQVLSPRIVGGSVGLHPVWIIFAVFAFGYLFGFVGMLVAVPAAAAIGVLVRFVLEEYRQSRLYAGDVPLSASSEVKTAEAIEEPLS